MGFVQEIVGALQESRYESRLSDYCMNWRSHATDYTICNVVQYATAGYRKKELFETLVDPDFRCLRYDRFGVNALRTDLQNGLEFFAAEQPDIYSYLRLLFLEQEATKPIAPSMGRHRLNCQQYEEFLQLDIPAESRRDVGLQRVLNRLFPVKPSTVRACIELIDYELGKWHCRCGELEGHSRRYDYQCDCGGLQGHGQLEAATVCDICACPPQYAVCPTCHTRVTLSQLWEIKLGSIDPDEFELPLRLNLCVKRPRHPPKTNRAYFMHLPLMLGVQERGGRISFDLPDLFWLSQHPADAFSRDDPVNRLVGPADWTEFADDKSFCEILETILEEVLAERPREAWLGRKYTELFHLDKERGAVPSSFFLTEVLYNKLCKGGNAALKSFWKVGDLVRFVEMPVDCEVATSEDLRGDMVIVNERLTYPGSLAIPSCVTYMAVLRDTPAGQEMLTPNPGGIPRPPQLGDDGIVRVGSMVRKGDLLIGIEAPYPKRERTPEEKLFEAIFELPMVPEKIDRSIRVHNIEAGRVLRVDVIKGIEMEQDIEPGHGKFIKDAKLTQLGIDELFGIRLILATHQPAQVGDSLFDAEGRSAVICEVASGAAIAKRTKSPREADLVVAPDHPWAPTSVDHMTAPIRLRLRSDALMLDHASSHAEGNLSLRNFEPVFPAQTLECEDWDWLLAVDAQHLTFELLGPRCDCRDWRHEFYSQVVFLDRRLADLSPPSARAIKHLSESPSESLRHLGFLLLAGRVSVQVDVAAHLSLSFRLMSDADVRSNSYGAIVEPQLFKLSMRGKMVHRVIKHGLWCEQVFGPVQDWQCGCGKLNGRKNKGQICSRCGVEIAESQVRDSRQGHVELSYPVVHPWLLRNTLSVYLGIPRHELSELAYRRKHIVLDSDPASPGTVALLSTDELLGAMASSGTHSLATKTGAKAIDTLLAVSDATSGLKRVRQHLAKRSVKRSRDKTAPVSPDFSCSVFSALPILPPGRRPFLQLALGNFSSGLNDLYNQLICQNNNAGKMRDLNPPQQLYDLSVHLLQNAIDAVFQNRRSPEPRLDDHGHALQDLEDEISAITNGRNSLLEGLLVRHVNYSACTRLVVSNVSDLDTALVPSRFAWDLLKAAVVRHLRSTSCATRRMAFDVFNSRNDLAWEALGTSCEDAVVLIAANVSPYRLVALRPQLTNELAVKIHPELMDMLGWENLGQPVKLFGVFSEEAVKEATEKLLPSHLREHGIPTKRLAELNEEKRRSALFIPTDGLIDEIALRAFLRESYHMTVYDYLILRAAEFLEYAKLSRRKRSRDSNSKE